MSDRAAMVRDDSTLAKTVRGFASAIALTIFAGVAQAGVRVSTVDHIVVVEAREASLAQIVAQLNATLNLHIKLTASINRTYSGTYRGPLRKVLAGLLDGHSFVMTSKNGTLTVAVIGAGAVAVPGARAPLAAASAAIPDEPAAPNSWGWSGSVVLPPPKKP